MTDKKESLQPPVPLKITIAPNPTPADQAAVDALLQESLSPAGRRLRERMEANMQQQRRDTQAQAAARVAADRAQGRKIAISIGETTGKMAGGFACAVVATLCVAVLVVVSSVTFIYWTVRAVQARKRG